MIVKLSIAYTQCHMQALYAKCHYAECSYAGCRGTFSETIVQQFFKLTRNLFATNSNILLAWTNTLAYYSTDLITALIFL